MFLLPVMAQSRAVMCDARVCVCVCAKSIQITHLYGLFYAKHTIISGGATVLLSFGPHCPIHACCCSSYSYSPRWLLP